MDAMQRKCGVWKLMQDGGVLGMMFRRSEWKMEGEKERGEECGGEGAKW